MVLDAPEKSSATKQVSFHLLKDSVNRFFALLIGCQQF
jgi:hypothetical protein